MDKCPNYENCGGWSQKGISSWCEDCDRNLSLRDKYYMIGYTDPWPVMRLTGEFEVFYYLGVADRKAKNDE